MFSETILAKIDVLKSKIENNEKENKDLKFKLKHLESGLYFNDHFEELSKMVDKKHEDNFEKFSFVSMGADGDVVGTFILNETGESFVFRYPLRKRVAQIYEIGREDLGYIIKPITFKNEGSVDDE